MAIGVAVGFCEKLRIFLSHQSICPWVEFEWFDGLFMK